MSKNIKTSCRDTFIKIKQDVDADYNIKNDQYTLKRKGKTLKISAEVIEAVNDGEFTLHKKQMFFFDKYSRVVQ